MGTLYVSTAFRTTGDAVRAFLEQQKSQQNGIHDEDQHTQCPQKETRSLPHPIEDIHR